MGEDQPATACPKGAMEPSHAPGTKCRGTPLAAICPGARLPGALVTGVVALRESHRNYMAPDPPKWRNTGYGIHVLWRHRWNVRGARAGNRRLWPDRGERLPGIVGGRRR